VATDYAKARKKEGRKCYGKTPAEREVDEGLGLDGEQ